MTIRASPRVEVAEKQTTSKRVSPSQSLSLERELRAARDEQQRRVALLHQLVAERQPRLRALEHDDGVGVRGLVVVVDDEERDRDHEPDGEEERER